MHQQAGFRRGLVYVVGFIALAAVPVLALNSLATADPGAGPAAEGFTPAAAHHGLTGALRQCLIDQGVTLPARPADGSRPVLTPEQRDALRKAAVACGLLRGPRGSRGVGEHANV